MSPATGVGKTGLWPRQGGPFKGEKEKSKGCQQARGQHWVPGPLPRRCQAHQVGLRGEGRGAWGCGDVMVPRRGRKEEGRRGDKGRAQATGLTGGCQPGRGRGEFSLHPLLPPSHPRAGLRTELLASESAVQARERLCPWSQCWKLAAHLGEGARVGDLGPER